MSIGTIHSHEFLIFLPNWLVLDLGGICLKIYQLCLFLILKNVPIIPKPIILNDASPKHLKLTMLNA